MGDRGFEEQGFCFPSSENLMKELKDKENMFKDKRKPVLPRTPLPTELPHQSRSYYSNNFHMPSFPVAPNVSQKPWAMASSNQSVVWPPLSNSGSLVPSPPIAPIGSGRGRNNQGKNFNTQGQIRNFTPVNPPNTFPATVNGTMWRNQQAGGHFGNGGHDVMPRMAWSVPPVQNQGRSFGGAEMRPVGYGGALKRGRAGTGVFLPRRFNNTTPQSRKRTGGSTAQPPPRALAQAPNKRFGNVTPHPQFQRPFIGIGHIPGNEIVIARRNAAAASSAEGMGVNNEIRLPPDWTY